MADNLLNKSVGRKTGAGRISPLTRGPKGEHRAKKTTAAAETPAPLTDRTLRCRYELKYRISEAKALAVAQFIKPYIHLDHYSRLQPDGNYPIVSLYLDSMDFKLCKQTLHGHKNRFKLRIRSYSDDPDYPRFFEIKRRINTIIIKSRARVKHHDVTKLLAGAFPPPQRYREDRETLDQFMFYVRSINAGPAVRIRYMRKAFEGDSENRVRITFDTKLSYNVCKEPSVELGGPGWRMHHSTDVILEIKFTERYPAWLTRMAKFFGLRQQSVSKYASSVEDSCLLQFCAPRISV